MTDLTARQQSFINWMTRGADYAWKGFEELLKPGRNIEKAFIALCAAGLFEPKHNPPPLESKPGTYQVPYWKALDYLVALSKIAGERNDLALADRVMQIVRAVTQNCTDANEERGNYHTYREFAKIIGLLPTSAVRLSDIEMMPTWLGARFDNGGVTHEIGERTLPSFLASPAAEDTEKACRTLFHFTAIHWVDEKGWNEVRKKPASVADDFTLKELMAANSRSFGSKAGKRASETLAERLREVFGTAERENLSHIWRPAIEDHGQNHSFYELENLLIEGLRDVVGAWLETDPQGAGLFAQAMLTDGAEIVRRIGIHLLNEYWPTLSPLYPRAISAGLLEVGELHESYRLLQTRFAEFHGDDRALTIDAIRRITLPAVGEEADRVLRSIQRRLLSAIRGKGYEPADKWFAELNSDPALGVLSDHPDFISYMEVGYGFGPSPYPTNELIGLAEQGSLVETLNAFQQPGILKGPTTKGLVQSLEEAVVLEPSKLLRVLSAFQHAKRPFQYAVINGFMKLWRASKEKPGQVDWSRAWLSLFDFFEKVLASAGFWTEDAPSTQDMTPTVRWIPPLIADFLSEGSRSDDRAFPSEMLPRAWRIIELLLTNAEPAKEPGRDPMSQTINSLRGKAIEALVIHALRECRLMQREAGEHKKAWERIRPTFEEELAKCRNSNFEFSTLAGDYLLHLEFLDAEWLRSHVKEIFPAEFPLNSVCAFHGLAYAHESRSIYALLADNGIIDQGLRLDLEGGQARERLIQRIAIAYIWSQEELDSPRLSYMFDSRRVADLTVAAQFFAEIQSDSEEHAERILAFWDRCLSFAQTLPDPPADLLSVLSRLAWYLKMVGPKEKNWLLSVAPYVSMDHNISRFIQHLDALADKYPKDVCDVLDKVFTSELRYYDHEDRIEFLLDKLLKHGFRTEVTLLIERLRPSVPDISKLFSRLKE